MRPEDETRHYVPADVIPEIAASCQVSEFFRALTTNDVGGGIVRHRGELFYVTGQSLGAAVEARASSTSFEEATAKRIADYLPRIATAPIQPNALRSDVDATEVLRDSGVHSMVHRVVQGESLKGLLFIQAATRSTITVAPPIWLCEDGDENTDPDRGDCAWCPRRIKELKK